MRMDIDPVTGKDLTASDCLRIIKTVIEGENELTLNTVYDTIVLLYLVTDESLQLLPPQSGLTKKEEKHPR